MRRIRFRGFTLIETTIVMVIGAIIAAAVLPKLMQAWVEARETTALQHLRTIHTAQASYFSKYGAFAAKIAQLGPPPTAGLISSDLARGGKDGLSLCHCSGGGGLCCYGPASSGAGLGAQFLFG